MWVFSWGCSNWQMCVHTQMYRWDEILYTNICQCPRTMCMEWGINRFVSGCYFTFVASGFFKKWTPHIIIIIVIMTSSLRLYMYSALLVNYKVDNWLTSNIQIPRVDDISFDKTYFLCYRIQKELAEITLDPPPNCR